MAEGFPVPSLGTREDHFLNDRDMRGFDSYRVDAVLGRLVNPLPVTGRLTGTAR